MKQFRYLVDGKPATNWFDCNKYTIDDFEIEEIYLEFVGIDNWQIEYREV